MARNLADTPFRNITIELLKPQGEANNKCASVVTGQSFVICDPLPFGVRATPQFETAESRLDLVTIFSIEEERKTTASKQAFLVVGLSGPEVKINQKGNPSKTLHAGEIQWFDAGSDAQFTREGAKVPQFLKLIFKDSASHAKP